LEKKDHQIKLLQEELEYNKKINEDLKKKQRGDGHDFDCRTANIAKCQVGYLPLSRLAWLNNIVFFK